MVLDAPLHLLVQVLPDDAWRGLPGRSELGMAVAHLGDGIWLLHGRPQERSQLWLACACVLCDAYAEAPFFDDHQLAQLLGTPPRCAACRRGHPTTPSPSPSEPRPPCAPTDPPGDPR